jgi:hypothetical protein
LKSKNTAAVLLFKSSGTNIGHRSPLFEQTLGRICSNNICPTSIF